ncbi:ATP-grasp fold amidoligase family protein [Desulfosporosinus hippei]|nr:ATP-grasp fold amidoligase family protein [Desulfosporosinus hippei]
MSDKTFLSLVYRARMGKKLNILNPKTFNEKLQWLKIYDRNPLYTTLVDKLAVRKYIGHILGEECLIPILGAYDSFDEIDFENLPNQFVLKCTHDSGGLVICKNKRKFDKEAARSKINRCLKRNYFYHGREWPYKNVKPHIICEQYIVNENYAELNDFKFMCFNGEPKCSFVCLNRNSPAGLNVDFYDMDWNPMSFERHYPRSGTIIEKPKNFTKMIEFSKQLSKDIPFLRVDFYEVNGVLYFGELTFYPGNGFEEFTPEEFDYALGEWIRLPL